MKNLFFLLASLLAFPVFAQKVDLDGEEVTARFIQLPSHPLPATYQNYSAQLKANAKDLQYVNLSEFYFTSNMKVLGYHKVESDGNFKLELTLSEYVPGKTEMKINTTQEKDRAGTIVEKKTYYYTCDYTHSLVLQVRGIDGKVMDTKQMLPFAQLFTSPEYNSASDLAAYGQAGLNRDLAKADQHNMTGAVKELYDYINARYGYRMNGQQVKLQILDSEKHPDYAGFQQAYQTAKVAMATMRANQPVDSVRQMLQPAMDYFVQQKDKYNAEDKNERKLKYACLYNLALLSFWLEDWDKSTEYANAVIANDYDPKDGKHLLEDIQELKTNFEKTGKTTRHLDFPPEKEIMPAKVEMTEEQKAEIKQKSLALTAKTVQHEGWVTGIDGKETKVLFLIENPGVVGLSFSASVGNVRYATDLGQRYAINRIEKTKLAAFGFDGRSFTIPSIKTAGEVATTPSKTILETIYDSPKVQACLAYTSDNEGILANQPEYIIHKVTDQEYISLSGLRFAFNLNKGIKKSFDDCPAVMAVVDKDGFKRTNDDIINLAKLLEGCAK